MEFSSIEVIINPAASQNDAVLHALYPVLRDAGIHWDVSITHKTGDGTRLARKALDAGADAIVVYGGDGTVREVAKVLAGTDIPLAILPGGTGNILASEMEIPRLIRRSARLLAAGNHRLLPVDVGMVNGEEPFLVGAATGVIAGVMQNSSREVKNRLGILAYFLQAFRELQNPNRSTYRITIDGVQIIEEQAIASLIANGTTVPVARVSVPRGTDIQDGLLDVTLAHNSDVQTILSLAADVMGIEVEEVTQPLSLPRWQGKHIHVEADPPQPLTLDGDVVGSTPFEAAVLPGALKIVVPKQKNQPLLGGRR